MEFDLPEMDLFYSPVSHEPVPIIIARPPAQTVDRRKAKPPARAIRKPRLDCRRPPCVRSRTHHPISALRKKAPVQSRAGPAPLLSRREISGACRTVRAWSKPKDVRRKKPRDLAGEAESARRYRCRQPA